MDNNQLDLALIQYGTIIETILKVNLTDESFEIIKAEKDSIFAEVDNEKIKGEVISQWYLDNIFLPNKDYIHPNDAEAFLCFVNIYSNYKDFVEKKLKRRTFFYRGMTSDENYAWKRMEIVPVENFLEFNPKVYVYITSASKEVSRALSLKAQDEDYYVNNDSAMYDRIDTLFDNSVFWNGSVGVIAFVPKHEDRCLVDFVKDCFAPIFEKNNCYYGYDETTDRQVIYAVVEGKTEQEFYNNILVVHKKLKKDGKDYSIRHVWTNDENFGVDAFFEQLNRKMRTL